MGVILVLVIFKLNKTQLIKTYCFMQIFQNYALNNSSLLRFIQTEANKIATTNLSEAYRIHKIYLLYNFTCTYNLITKQN